MLPFPQTLIGRLAWLSSAAAAATACVLVGLTVKEAAPIVLGQQLAEPIPVSTIEQKPSASSLKLERRGELVDAVRQANDLSSAKYRELIDYWRAELTDARSRGRLKSFVDGLTGYGQKMHYGVNLVYGNSGDERVLASFRKLILDDLQLSADLEATVEKYAQFLADQDRRIRELAGEPHSSANLVQVKILDSMIWRFRLEPVIARAAREARLDAVRTAGSWAVGDLAGNELNQAARRLRVNKSAPGSWGDRLWGGAFDVGAGFVFDRLTDPTERIIKGLRQDLSQAESIILDGDKGLCAQLNSVRLAHEAARAQWLAAATR